MSVATAVAAPVSRTEAATAAHTKRADVQGMRAVAVLLVVAFHGGLSVPGGFTGVDVFFAISGFVITGVLLRELVAADRVSLPRFYARRIKRLLPALALMLVVVAAIGIVASPVAAQQIGAKNGIWAAIFSANLFLYRLTNGYFSVKAELNPLLHTWTLAVEEQFYLVFPALLLIGWRTGRRFRRTETAARLTAAALIGGVSLVSFLLSAAIGSGWHPRGITSPDRFAFYGSPTRAWEFGAGAMLAVLAPWLARLGRNAAAAVSVTGLAVVMVGAFSIKATAGFPGTAALLPVLGTCAMLAAGCSARSGAYPLLANRPAVFIGDLSYSWYLWHWPLIVYARALWPLAGWVPAVAAFASLGPAWLSFRYVENPIRRDRTLVGRRVAVLGFACVIMGIAASAALAASRHLLDHTAALQQWSRSQTAHADVTAGCESPVPLGDRGSRSCVWRVSRPHGEVVLIGDSNAGHFTEPFVRAANRLGFNAEVATYGDCPFVPVPITGTLAPASMCQRFDRRSLAAISASHPALVVVAARTSDYLKKPSIGFIGPDDRVTHRSAEKARLWERGLHSELEELSDAGVRVVLIHPTPQPPVDPVGCAVVRVLTNACIRTFDRRQADRDLSASVAVEEQARVSTRTAWTMSVEDHLCTKSACATIRNGTLLYRDKAHLSVGGALTLTNTFEREIKAHAAKRF